MVGKEKVMKYMANVANRKQVKAMFDAAIEKFEKDISSSIVLNQPDARFTELTDELWDAVVSSTP